ncbi:DMT family protein [Hufsiella ginkgonis]|uniref:Uncharacterized protein n=1 Tax=Hufsiella ginkgonis TaxID=2695274 RepID=A0A7K1XS93_9SPHI|nr:hypothetical protein [Hufsiella ginkgonis]
MTLAWYVTSCRDIAWSKTPGLITIVLSWGIALAETRIHS